MPQPRPFLLDIPSYKLGESSVPGVARVIVLASNECAADPSPLAIAAYQAHAGRLRRYADGATTELRAAIGACHGLDAARIVCGNGSEELIGLLVRAYAGPGDEVLHSEHGYALFALSARISGATPTAVPERDLVCEVDALLARVTSRTRLVLLANPNNPTGSCLAAGEVERLRRALPDDVLLVLDAAYAEYVMRADYEPGARLVEAYDNVVMLRTFSKIYGLASLRLGWAYCPRGVADVLHRTRPPSNVSGPAQAAAIAALADQAHVAQNYAENARWRAWFTAEIARLGFKPYRSEGNFVLVRFGGGPQRAADAYAFLKSRGIIARPMAAYRLDDCLRFTIGTGDEMEAVNAALKEFTG